MDLFDFFFPEQALASHVRKIATRQKLAATSAEIQMSRTDEVSALKADVRFLTLVVTVILKRLAESETMSLADVQDLLSDVDALDGSADGGLEPGVLRDLLGVLRQEPSAADTDEAALRAIAELHRRHRS